RVQGDLLRGLPAGRSSVSPIKGDDLPANLRAMKPEQRLEEVNRQLSQRKELNEKLSALGAKIRRRPPRQRTEGVVLRSRGRGYVEGADQAVRLPGQAWPRRVDRFRRNSTAPSPLIHRPLKTSWAAP